MPMPDAPTVAFNPWLRCSLLTAFFFYLPGLAWGWIGRAGRARPGRPAAWLLTAATSLLTGTLVSLLACLLLAECSVLTLGRLALLVGFVTWVGIVLGAFVGPRALRRHIGLAAPGLALVVAGAIVVMSLPRCGEWIAGGWDPGTYVNQGVAVSRTGSFRFAPDPFFRLLTPSELEAFTRPAHNYTEAFPVVPIDPESRSLQHFFFRLTPALIALMDLCGGLRAATRVNGFVGLFAMVAFAAAALRLTRRWPAACFAALLLLAQPVWLYHLHIPTSEISALFLLCGIALACFPAEGNERSAIAIAVLLFAAAVNRFSFVLFGGLLLVLLAGQDLSRTDRRRVERERLLQIAALAAGALFGYAASSVTLGRLGTVVPVMIFAFVALAVVALIVDALGGRETWRVELHRFYDAWALPAAALLVAALAVAAFALRTESFRGLWFNVVTLRPFIGSAVIALAAAGAGALAFERDGRAAPLKTWCAFLLISTAATMTQARIAPLMPWATRRYIEFTLPLAALLAGGVLGRVWDRGRWWARAAAAGLLVAALALNAGRSCRAWTCTEYDGLSEQLAAIAGQVSPRDVVVADHFRWGVPLRIIYGKATVNGELFLTEAEAPRMRAALRTLAGLARKGWRIRFLTSTDKDLAVWPVRISEARLDWESRPWRTEEVRHGKAVDDFTLRRKERVFRLYTWTPDDL